MPGEPHIVKHVIALEQRRQTTQQTLGIVRPVRLLGLDITPVENTAWTDEEKASLLREGLFDSNEVRTRPPLRKLPYTFHYRYECATPDGMEEYRHMITDWEAGALYWNCQRDYGRNWEQPFRKKLEEEFGQKDLLFLMGTVHRFPDRWLIIGLIYPPRLPALQLSLDLDG